MSKCAKEFAWDGGTHVFDLASPRVSWMLQAALSPFPGLYGDTPMACLQRFHDGVWSPTDVERIFEIGLIGGGQSREAAAKLVFDHVRGQPLAANALIATNVISNLISGVSQ